MTWQTWAIILAFAIPKPIAVFAFCESLTPKLKKTYILLPFVAGCALLTLVRALCFIYIPAIPDGIIYILFIPVYCFLCFRFTCRDSTSKIAFIVVLIYALGILSHILAAVVFYALFSEPIVIDFVGDKSMYIGLIAMFFEVLLYSVFLFIWKRYIGRIRSDIPNMWAFLLIIGGQLVYSVAQLLLIIQEPVEVDPWTAVGIIVVTVGNLALLQILLTNSKKKEAEEQLKEVQHIRELEQMHYASVESRRQEIIKIRHDFGNQLATAHQLIAANKRGNADELLGELEKSLDSATECIFCQNAIVNAVLTEKQKDCDTSGIRLEAEVLIAEDCNITQIHLCSIFTNLLDNAIHACEPLEKEQRKIEIRTAVKGDYLHIKCVNPVSDNMEKGRSGKGYGKIILSDIASHYGGNFTAERSNDMHVAMMSLLAI